MIQPKYGELSCARLIGADAKIRVEGVFKDLDEVKKPISVSANAFLLSKEVKGDVLSVKAKVVFTLIYLSDEGYKKAVCDVDGSADLPMESSNVSVFVTDVKVITANGFTAVATLNFKGEGKTLSSHGALCGGDGICVKEKELLIDIYNNEKSGSQVISDEFSLDFTVGEVLSYCACAYLTDVKGAMGKVILEGEAVLTVKALPFSENNDIVKERRVIPFRYELEDVDAMQGDRAYASVCVTATNVKVYSDEGKDKSSVLAEITLLFSGGVISSQSVSVVEDAYSKTNDCQIEKQSIRLLSYREQKYLSEKTVCQGASAIEGGRILTVLGENLSVVSLKQSEGVAVADGIIKADVVFKNADNGIVSVGCESPFSVEFAVNGPINAFRVELTDLIARVRNGEIELEAHLKMHYCEYEETEVSCIKEISELALRNNLDGAICVCMGKKGDELWDIAKKLGSDEKEILNFNEDVEFPLESDERIIIYRQKL